MSDIPSTEQKKSHFIARTTSCRLWRILGLFNGIIFLSFQSKAPEFASGIFIFHLRMSDWHQSSHPVDLTSSSPSLSLKERAYISQLISLHVKREFCFLNAFAMSSTWDLQIHLRSWFAHHCWMQDSVKRAQLSVGSEAGCQSAMLPTTPPLPLESPGQADTGGK